TARVRVLPSRPASDSRVPPTNSIARSTSGPVRAAVPRVKSSAVRLARPSASGGSKTDPARTYTRTTTMGMEARAARQHLSMSEGHRDAGGGQRPDQEQRHHREHAPHGRSRHFPAGIAGA